MEMRAMGHVNRVESHATAIGVPDVEICINAEEYWIELKVADAKGNMDIRPSQKMWHKLRHQRGGSSFLFVEQRAIINGKDSYFYILSPDLNLGDNIRDHMELSSLWSGKVNWREFAKAIKHAKEQRKALFYQSTIHAESARRSGSSH